MKRNPLLAGLVAMLFLSCTASVLLATRHFFAIVELQRLQVQTANVNNTLRAAQSLATDALTYGRRNSALTSVLSQFSAKLPPTTNAAPDTNATLVPPAGVPPPP